MKTADRVFWQSSFPHPYLLPGCFQEVISPPPFPLGDWSACHILSVPIWKQRWVRFWALCSSHNTEEGASPWYEDCHIGHTSRYLCMPNSQKLRAFSLPSCAWRTHVIEYTWLRHVLLCTWIAQGARTSYLDSDTNKGSCGHKSLL